MTASTPVVKNYRPHTLFSFGGHLQSGSPTDIWQVGVRLADFSTDPLGAPLSDPAAYLIDRCSVSTAFTTWFHSTVTSTANGIPSNVTLEWAKCNTIKANGDYLDAVNPHTYVFSTPPVGGASGGVQNWMNTLAITWRTDTASRDGRRGRIYLPLNLPSSWSPVIGASSYTAYPAFGKSLLSALAAANFNATPIVASSVNATLHKIIAVAVGSVVDVQRRRKSAIPETYSTVSFP